MKTAMSKPKGPRAGRGSRGCNPLDHHWAHLTRNPTRPELAFEPLVASLGRPYRFQYQIPGTKFIADFALIQDRVLIEVDGSSHESDKARAADAERDARTAKMGWRTVRVSNEAAIAMALSPDYSIDPTAFSGWLGSRLAGTSA